MEWQFHAADARDAIRARTAFAGFLRDACTIDSDFTGAELVFGELVANVVCHAPGSISILARAEGSGAVRLLVRDRGKAFELTTRLPSSPLSERGRGLGIISGLARDVSTTRTATGNIVSVVLPVTSRKL